MNTLQELVLHNEIERERFETLMETLAPYAHLIEGQRVLDFGSAYGGSLCALLEYGAAQVVGVEPDPERVETGKKLLERAGIGEDRAAMHYEADTSQLSFPDGSFPVVMCNAVLEHIPQPRHPFIAEMWRLLAPGGTYIVNETPNKYYPQDKHTTGLWFVPWLPERIAESYASLRGCHPGEPWHQSGWRGIGYWELTQSLTNFELIPELYKPRQRLFHKLGLPPSVIDPYPCWVFRKGA